MKTNRYITMAVAAMLACSVSSCMDGDDGLTNDDWKTPATDVSPYGNNSLQETNVVTIAQLKEKYATVISNSSYTEVSEDLQIKGIVTGNDIEGNLYNEIALQDETGATLISIYAGGLYGSLPVGQQVLVDLKGLIIGGYGQQVQIGGIYTNSSTGAQSVGRMSRTLWEQHYKLIGKADAANAEALRQDFDLSKRTNSTYLAENAGKLMTLRMVSFKDADGNTVYAPDDGSVTLTANCANRQLVDRSGSTPKNIGTSSLVVRTSSYADFANDPMPTQVVNITGIFTRYRNVWQVLIRSTKDVEVVE